jgi:D-alanyl-D-alanine dipeptidase
MRIHRLVQGVVALVLSLLGGISMSLPMGFVYLDEVDPTILQDIRYFSENNFVGKRIKGYEAPRCILTREAAVALQKIQSHLRTLNLGLKVYDGYRPERAVQEFVDWSQDVSDQKMKADYYPNVDKADFFRLEYVASPSTHSRGSTVDLTIVHLKADGAPVDMAMGTHFDFMDETSHPLNPTLPIECRQNRLLLRNLMQNAGFAPVETEWWHFTLKNEPFPHQTFNFVVR